MKYETIILLLLLSVMDLNYIIYEKLNISTTKRDKYFK